MAQTPSAKDVRHLKASSLWGAVHISLATVMTLAGLALSLHSLEYKGAFFWQSFDAASLAYWIPGQILLALAFVQWFILLHEAGHGTLFRSAKLNRGFGYICSFFTAIPFEAWRVIHGMHHKWTGWQDKDPTTASLVPRELSAIERLLINGAWASGLPLFTLLYRIRNFWNFPTLLKYAPHKRMTFIAQAIVMALSYGLVLWFCGPLLLLHLIGIALFASFVFLDPLMLSQHTHIPMPVAGDADVKPLKAPEQEPFTRSVIFPSVLSRWWLLGFDHHEAHHVFPQVPGHHLHRIPLEGENAFPFFSWLLNAKALRGEEFLFSNRHKSGRHL